jgi:SPP1 gp7 family putative phage head morphogenesis protein
LPDVDEVFDEEDAKRSLAAILFPFLLLGFQKGIDLALKQGPGTTRPEDIFTLGVRHTLQELSLKHAAQAVQTTKDQLASILKTAIDEGQSIPEVAKVINDQCSLDSRVRSVRIARTELTRVITDAKVRTLHAEGYTEKQWSTVIDGRERESHHAANGQVVAIDGMFRVGAYMAFAPGDETLPASESVNCRCDVVGAGVPEERRLELGRLFLRTHGALERRCVLSLRREFERQRRRVLSHFPS